MTLGDVAQLISVTPTGKLWTVEHFVNWINPALELDQYQAAFDGYGCMTSFVSFAWLGDQALKQFEAGEFLTFDDWRSGEQLYFVDFFSISGTLRFVQHLRRYVFPNCKAKALRTYHDQKAQRFVRWAGVDA